MTARNSDSKSAFDFDINLDKMLYRPRINSLLEKGLSYPLTLIWAPAGYGKTTAAMQFAKNSNLDVIYMSLSELDRKPQYFWAHMSSLYKQIWPYMGDVMDQIGFPFSAAQFEQQVDIARQYMGYPRKHVLIVDDYHIAHNTAIDELLDKVTRQRIKNAHIFILSRSSLNSFLLDFKIKGIAMEITKEDMRFDCSEIIEYYNMYNINLEETGARNVESFTEGWASAVFLSSLYIKKDKDKEANLDAAALDLNHLIQNIFFNDYSREVQDFLLRLSVLERFDMEICNYIMGMSNTRELLAEILNRNSLIKISEDGNYYQMHSLFRDFLRQKLSMKDPEMIEELYNRVGEYYSYRNDVVTALGYFDFAGNHEKIVEMILKNKFSDTFSLAQLEMIVTYLQKLPQEYYIKNPMLLVILAFLLTRSKHPQRSGELIQKVEELCKNPQMPEEFRNKLLGEAAVVKSLMAFNNLTIMREFHIEACRLLPHGSELLSKSISFTFGSPSMLYLYYNKPGNLDQIVKDYLEEFHWWEKITPCGYGANFLIKAEAEFERCNYKEAEEYAYRSIYRAEQKEQNSIILAAKFLLIRLCIAEGNYGKAAVFLQEMKSMVSSRKALVYSTALDMCIGFFNLYTGDFERIPKWLYNGEMDKSSISMNGFGFEYLIYTALLLHKGDFLRLESLIQPMSDAFAPYNYQYGIIRTHILKGIIDFNLYGTEKALASINSAYGIAMEDSLIMPFLEYGEFLLALLNRIAKEYGSLQPAFPIEWLRLIIKKQKEYQKSAYKFKAGFRSINPGEVKDMPKLTRREREILSLIAKGYSGEDIARELFVTINNVKVITSKVYRKIGVKSRAEAVKFVHDNRINEINYI